MRIYELKKLTYQ